MDQHDESAPAEKIGELTGKQAKFVDVYDGNGTDAARLAGYSGNDDVLAVTAHRLLRNTKVRAAIEARLETSMGPLIANREERQQLWTEIMSDPRFEARDRLKASELLGKSQADFTERHEHSGPGGAPIQVSSLTDAELDAKLLTLLAKTKGDGAGSQ